MIASPLAQRVHPPPGKIPFYVFGLRIIAPFTKYRCETMSPEGERTEKLLGLPKFKHHTHLGTRNGLDHGFKIDFIGKFSIKQIMP